MCEYSTMNQSAALRREARRRKILENSANRLKLIEGVNSSSERTSYPEPVDIPEIKTAFVKPNEDIHSCEYRKPEPKLSDVIKENKELKDISDFLLQNEKEIEREEELDEVEEETEEVREIERKEDNWMFRFFFEKRLHYVLLAVFVNVLLFFNVGFLFYENIFCPFYTVKIIELISRRGEKEEFPLFLFLLLAGLPNGLQKLAKNYLVLITGLVSDLLLYIFIFLVGTKVVNIQV